MNAYRNMLGGYRDRVARIALFDVFHQLENRQMKDDEGRPIDGFDIGLLSVLFFFENMLMSKHRTGIRELAAFLRQALEDRHSLSQESAFLLAKQAIEIMRPANGQRLKRRFYNYETGQEETVTYALLRADEWDAKNRIQYYTLDEEGLALIFATKEYFGEFQISISQLVLKKQLEKGEFASALRQVDEMRINVHNIRDKMTKIKHEIQRNIISDDTYDRYKEIIEDINRRLKQEHDEFETLAAFIQSTKGRLDYQSNQGPEDMAALDMIVRVDNELAHVHYLHASLLKDSIELKTTAIEAAGESLYYAGVTAFNFDQEVARKMTTSPLPLMSVKALGAPFTTLGRHESWSLMSVFDRQLLNRPDRHKNTDFLEVDEADASAENDLRQQVNRLLFREMIAVAGDRRSFSLKDILTESDNPVFGTREFCDIWVILHQLSPMAIQDIMAMDDHMFARAFAESLSGYATISVEEMKDTISVRGNYEMNNMGMTLEPKGGEHHDR